MASCTKAIAVVSLHSCHDSAGGRARNESRSLEMRRLSEAAARRGGRSRSHVPRMRPCGVSDCRREAVDALLDAAERLLVEQGYGAITTRNLAERAGVNHGLVHYYFGSMEEVMVQVLERFTARLIERQRAMYSSDRPFLEKWRTAWAFQEQDLSSGYSKIWLELQAMAWNRPELRARVQQVNEEWRRVLTEAFAPALREYGFDALSLEATVSLVMTMAQGYALEKLSDIDEGHASLLSEIDSWMKSRTSRAQRSRPKKGRSSRRPRGSRPASRAAPATPTPRVTPRAKTVRGSSTRSTGRGIVRSSSCLPGPSCTHG